MSYKYDKFYIPASLEDSKVFGFERDEIIIAMSLIFAGMFFSSIVISILGIFVAYKYKKFKSGKFHFMPNLIYSKFYDLANLKYMPKPFIKKIYGN